MKGLHPKTNNEISYLLVSEEKDKFTYVLPDGRVVKAIKSYFSEPFPIEDIETYTPQQIKISRLFHLDSSQIIFLSQLIYKFTTVMEKFIGKEEEILGGDTKVWFKHSTYIKDQTYLVEIQNSSKFDSLKTFIDKVVDGSTLCLKKKLKTTQIIGLMNDGEETYFPELAIYAKNK